MTRARAGALLLARLLLAAGALATGCGQEDKAAPTAGSASAPATAPAGTSQPAAVRGDPAKGRQAWLAHCVACHNTDPSRDGPVGPAVKGSSRELVEARVLRAGYPPGYKPKRESKAMPARPDLSASVSDLAAYLR